MILKTFRWKMTINNLSENVKSLEEKWKLVPAFLESRGLVKQHLDSFNYLVNHGLKKILKANEKIEVDQNLKWQYEVRYYAVHQLIITVDNSKSNLRI